VKTYTATVTGYAFDDLNDTGKENARRAKREALYEVGTLCDDMDFAVRYALLCAFTPAAAGEDGTRYTWDRLMDGCNVDWSLSHCQGDGVALSGTLCRDAAPLLPWPVVRDARGSFARVAGARLRHSGHYYHEYSFTVDLVDADGDEHAAPEAFVEALRDACRAAERAGYRAEDAATSDETIDETLRDEGATFDEFGGVLPWEFLRGVTL